MEKEVKVMLQAEFGLNKEKLESGELISEYVNTHADRVRIQPIGGCANNCKFCSMNRDPYIKKDIDKLDMCFNIALKDKTIRHALIAGGSAKEMEEDYQYLTDVYTHFGTKYNGFEIDVMMTPRGFKRANDVDDYENYIKYLKNVGISGLSVNIELYNEKYRQEYIPAKAKISLDNYMNFIRKAVRIFGKNKVRSAILVGLEPMEDTLKGVELLCKAGCVPVLSPYIPSPDLDIKMPSVEYMLEVKQKSEEIANKYNVPLGPLCEACKHNTL